MAASMAQILQSIWPILIALYVVGWLLLMLAPLRHRFCWIGARSCAVILAAVYSCVVIMLVFETGGRQLFISSIVEPSLAIFAIATFSLFIGSWQVEDAPRHAIPQRLILICLIATALTGPIGFLLHIVLRDFWKWRNQNAKP
jgi:hypothetical protein